MRAWNLSPRVAIGLLAGMLALDATLVVTALRPAQPNGGGTRALQPSVSSSPAPSPAASSRGVPATGTTEARPAAAPLVTMLMALDTKRAWRIEAGSCSLGGATLTSTVDGGGRWVRSSTSLSRIIRVQQTGSTAAFVVGAGSGCAAELRETSDGGLTWVGAAGVGRAWFRDPGKSSVVWAPGPVSSRPCGARPVLDLAALTAESARVLCSDGLVRSTTSHGTVWTNVATVDGALAMAVPTTEPTQTYVALANAPGCQGIQVRSVQTQARSSCVKVAIPAAAGRVALSLVRGGGWLAVGDGTMRSTDNLLSWQAS